MNRRRLLAGTASVGLGALAGCTSGFFARTVSENFSRTYDVSTGTTLSVDNRNGSVLVQRTDGDQLRVAGAKRGSTREALDSISIDAVEGEQFVVDVSFAGSDPTWDRSVTLTIDVPEGVTVDRVASENGGVTVTDVRGDVDATTSNGDVDVSDVDGFVALETVNGSVSARNTTGLRAARTTNGEVDVDLLAMRGDVRCASSNGSVTVRVGPDVAAGFRLTTSNGGATVGDLEYTATTTRDDVVEGRLRGGTTPTLVLSSENGDVTLRPAESES